MADQIVFRDGEVVFIEETFGGIDTAEFTVSLEEFTEYKLHLDIEGTIPLTDFITNIRTNEVEIDFSAFQTSTAEVREANAKTEDDDVIELTQRLEQTKRNNMPPIPDDNGLKTQTDNAFYKRLVENPDSQPARYRRLIRNEGEITRPKFDRWADRQGFEPETGGSHNACLLMLERIGEIDRRGRGDDQIIVWVGK